jgi:threonine dehydrogenase-like Zn-dependent dehydrogenase
MDSIANNNALISKLVTHKFALSEAEDAFKLQISGRCGKVLLHPWE